MNPPTVAARALRQEIRFTHVSSGARIAWSRSGRVESCAPMLVRAAHWMTQVEYDAVSPIFRPWLERLGRELRLVCYDERGCGLSGPDATAEQPAQAAGQQIAQATSTAASRCRARLRDPQTGGRRVHARRLCRRRHHVR